MVNAFVSGLDVAPNSHGRLVLRRPPTKKSSRGHPCQTPPNSPPAPDGASGHDGVALAARNRLVIGILMVSTFVVILNETIIGVAIPQFIKVFDIDASAAQWLSAAFMLTMAVVIPITGFLLQRFNTRPVFIAAMSFFSAGTLLAVLAPGFDVLLVARVVQACGTAIMFPLLITTIMELVPAQTRGRTMGNISIVISVAPAIGPSISGLILSTLHDWRWLFILVLPIAVAALIVGGIRVKNVTTPKRTKFDVLSVILSAFGFGGLVYGISNLGTATASDHRADRMAAARRRSRGHRAVRAAAAVAAEAGLGAARPSHLQVADLHVLDRDARGEHDRVLRNDHRAADLPRDRPASRHAEHRPASLARRAAHGLSRTIRWAVLRPARPDRAARHRHDHHQR